MIVETQFVKQSYLQKIYVFQDLNGQELEAAAGVMIPREFKAGQVVMSEGEPGHSMYFIASGEVQVSKTLTMKFGEDDFRETEKTMSMLKADDYVVFGEMALISEMERSATVTAIKDSTLYEISRDAFLALANENPSLGFKVTLRIAELVSKRLKKSGEDVVRLTTALSIALSR